MPLAMAAALKGGMEPPAQPMMIAHPTVNNAAPCIIASLVNREEAQNELARTRNFNLP